MSEIIDIPMEESDITAKLLRLIKRVEELEAELVASDKWRRKYSDEIDRYRKALENREEAISFIQQETLRYRKALEEIKKESGPGYGLDNNCGNCEMVQLIAKKALQEQREVNDEVA